MRVSQANVKSGLRAPRGRMSGGLGSRDAGGARIPSGAPPKPVNQPDPDPPPLPLAHQPPQCIGMGRALTAYLCGRRLWQARGACVRAEDCPQWQSPPPSPSALLPNVFQEKRRGFVDGQDRQDRQMQVRDALNQLLRLRDHARGCSTPPHQGGRWPSAAWQPSPLLLIVRSRTVTLFCPRFSVPCRDLAAYRPNRF